MARTRAPVWAVLVFELDYEPLARGVALDQCEPGAEARGSSATVGSLATSWQKWRSSSVTSSRHRLSAVTTSHQPAEARYQRETGGNVKVCHLQGRSPKGRVGRAPAPVEGFGPAFVFLLG